MAGHDYLNFDLTLAARDSNYTVRASAPTGYAESAFELPLTNAELENFILRMQGARLATRGMQSRRQEAAQRLGKTLYSALFTPELEDLLLASVQRARDQGAGLRIRLRLDDAPELVNVPWEYLHSQRLGRPLSPSNETLLVRYRKDDLPTWTLQVSPPIRVLVAGASPAGLPALQIDAEMRRLEEAVAELTRNGRIEIHRLEHATLGRLRRRLRKGAFHILHFIGHGMFHEESETGMLAFEDDEGRARGVTGLQLGHLLHDQREMRMVVINACEGARTGIEDPFGGVAHSLIRQGLSAVVAMQFEITDQSALAFSHEFYAAIAEGAPVDEAMAEARTAMMIDEESAEWGIPVLHLRTPDGRAFDVIGEPTPPDPAEVVAIASRIGETSDAAAVTGAIGMLRRLLAIDPHHREAAGLLNRLEGARNADEHAATDIEAPGTGEASDTTTSLPAGPAGPAEPAEPAAQGIPAAPAGEGDPASRTGLGQAEDEQTGNEQDRGGETQAHVPTTIIRDDPQRSGGEPGWLDRQGARLGVSLILVAAAATAVTIWSPWDDGTARPDDVPTATATSTSTAGSTASPAPRTSAENNGGVDDGLQASFAPVREGAWIVDRGWRVTPGGDEFVGIARLSSPDGQAVSDNHREVPPPAVAGDVNAIEWTPKPTAQLQSVGVFQNLHVDDAEEFIELEYRVPLDPDQPIGVADMESWFTEWSQLRQDFMLGSGDDLVEPIVTAGSTDEPS